jgi:carboxymethylenebutenolidase
MLTISRRSILAGVTLMAAPGILAAEPAETFDAVANEGPVSLTRYPANRSGKRPSVIVLHGARGIELKPLAYERYANALTADGIDAYLVRYYGPADEQTLQKLSTPESRDAYNTGRFDAWTGRVSSALTAILTRRDSSGRIGVLGFSLGGFVAAATAARDERVTALAVLYGGMPEKISPEVKRMPPLLELHGEADRIVPLASGEALVKLAKTAGAQAEQITYPGKPHAFDFADNDPATADAIAHVTGFFKTRLMPA